MKFINYLESITGVGIYPLIAQLLFVSVFVVALVSVILQSKESIDEQRNIPLN